MSSTATKTETLARVLTEADPNRLPDALHKVDLGVMLTPLVFDSGTLAGASTITLSPPALIVQSCRVVTATANTALGSYLVSDASADLLTANNKGVAGVCSISADGKTLTFAQNDVTRVLCTYIPRSANDVTAKFDDA